MHRLQGCAQSPTLFGIYIDDVSHYIERFGGSGACLTAITIQILLYADDIVMIFLLQRHLNALTCILDRQRLVDKYG